MENKSKLELQELANYSLTKRKNPHSLRYFLGGRRDSPDVPTISGEYLRVFTDIVESIDFPSFGRYFLNKWTNNSIKFLRRSTKEDSSLPQTIDESIVYLDSLFEYLKTNSHRIKTQDLGVILQGLESSLENVKADLVLIKQSKQESKNSKNLSKKIQQITKYTTNLIDQRSGNNQKNLPTKLSEFVVRAGFVGLSVAGVYVFNKLPEISQQYTDKIVKEFLVTEEKQKSRDNKIFKPQDKEQETTNQKPPENNRVNNQANSSKSNF
jgi:hypothetical protein